jgi:hypothetical protein
MICAAPEDGQFTEVAIAHPFGGDGTGAGLLATELDPLFGPEEEQLLAILIPTFGEVDRTSDGEAGLIETVGGGPAALVDVGATVAGPGVGIEGGVAEEVECVAVEVAGAAAADETHLATVHPAVLGGIVGGEDLHFLNAVDVEDAEGGGAGAGPDRVNAVNGNGVVGGGAAVDGEAGSEAVGVKGVEVASNDAGFHQGEVDGVAPVEREIVDLFGFDGASHECGFALDGNGGGSDGD